MEWSNIEKAFPGGAKFDIFRSDSKRIEIILRFIQYKVFKDAYLRSLKAIDRP